jgi:hypothetical protein
VGRVVKAELIKGGRVYGYLPLEGPPVPVLFLWDYRDAGLWLDLGEGGFGPRFTRVPEGAQPFPGSGYAAVVPAIDDAELAMTVMHAVTPAVLTPLFRASEHGRLPGEMSPLRFTVIPGTEFGRVYPSYEAAADRAKGRREFAEELAAHQAAREQAARRQGGELTAAFAGYGITVQVDERAEVVQIGFAYALRLLRLLGHEPPGGGGN